MERGKHFLKYYIDAVIKLQKFEDCYFIGNEKENFTNKNSAQDLQKDQANKYFNTHGKWLMGLCSQQGGRCS